MATTQSRAQMSVGSAAWIAAERENVYQLMEQETEEIVYPVQHEMEWLNEHMAEIFSKNQFNFTEVFKTPGKLRGKTPRTARKRNALEARVPLSDVFSSNNQNRSTASQSTKFNKQLATISIAKDASPKESAPARPPPSKPNTDSGYHGMTEDEMEVDPPEEKPETAPHKSKDAALVLPSITSPSDGRRTTEGSFHSAQETMTIKDVPADSIKLPVANERSREPTEKPRSPIRSPKNSPMKSIAEQQEESQPPITDNMIDAVLGGFDDIGSPSDGSTPDRPLVRKSSLTFASLPAREPLTTQKSIGARVSRTSHVNQAKALAAGRNSYYGRQTGGARLTQPPPEAENDRMDVDDVDKMDVNDETTFTRDESDAESKALKLHNKSSTQRLHEKINLLGKSQPSRPTKSIPSVATLAAPKLTYPELPQAKVDATAETIQKPAKTGSTADDDDDCIKPLAPSPHAQRPHLPKSHTADVMEDICGKDSIGGLEVSCPAPELMAHGSPFRPSPGPKSFHPAGYSHTKSASTSVLVSPSKSAMAPGPGHLKTISVSNPQLASTTPHGSPRRHNDGPLSASKSKLQSIMRTAKGLFTSSAGVSAAAKMETLSPSAMRAALDPSVSLYPSINGIAEKRLPQLPESPTRQEGRRTRSSTEKEERKREKEAKDRQRVDDQLERAREKERQKALSFKQKEEKVAEKAAGKMNPPAQATRSSPQKAQEQDQVRKLEVHEARMDETPLSQQTEHMSKPTEIRRPVKPTRDAIQKSRPEPVSIKVGTLSQRIPLSTASLASSIHESLPPPAPKQATVVKKPSNASMVTSASTSSFKTSVSSAASKPKALIAAERKKEQDEREAQRKLDQKREIERKRAAQQEEARRQEQRQRAEAERRERERAAADDPKKIAQKQAIEKRRLENARKLEQQRAVPPANNDMSNTQHTAPTTHCGDLGGPRPPSRLNSAQPLNRSMVNHPLPNPTKPPKRALEDDHGSHHPQGTKVGMAYHPTDSKRRKTDEESVQQPPMRPTMAPPIRQPNARKDVPKPSIFSCPPINQTVSAAPKNPTAPSHHVHHPAGNAQPYRVAHPTDMGKYVNGKIPFAEAPNPPQPMHKTPGQQHQQKVILVKSSPQYPNGEFIPLPEIATDSEDEDEEDRASTIPAWAREDEMERRLKEQADMDTDAIFGPIQSPHLEEIFKGGKDRNRRFRDRTSSANWGGPDGLTQEEIRRDNTAREELIRNGAWTYGL